MLDECYNYLREQGFIQRKATPRYFFYRVLGDGVFQRIVFHRHHSNHYPIISFSLCSLYDKLDNDLFKTATFVYPMEEIVALGKTTILDILTPYIARIDYNETVDGLKEQIDILYEKGIPLLNGIDSQGKIIEGYRTIEYRCPDSVCTSPILLPCYLKLRDWDHADMITSRLVEMYNIDSGIDLRIVPTEEFEFFYKSMQRAKIAGRQCDINKLPEDRKEVVRKLLAQIEHIRAKDEEWRKAYLEENYERNMALCREKHFVK